MSPISSSFQQFNTILQCSICLDVLTAPKFGIYLSNNAVESINTAWRIGIRRVWQVPYTTHSTLIPGLCDTLPLADLFYKRMLNFVYRRLRSDSNLVSFIVRHGIFAGEMDSVIGRNVLNLCAIIRTLKRYVNLNFVRIASINS